MAILEIAVNSVSKLFVLQYLLNVHTNKSNELHDLEFDRDNKFGQNTWYTQHFLKRFDRDNDNARIVLISENISCKKCRDLNVNFETSAFVFRDSSSWGSDVQFITRASAGRHEV